MSGVDAGIDDRDADAGAIDRTAGSAVISTRLVGASVSNDVWWWACTPAGGEVITGNW